MAVTAEQVNDLLKNLDDRVRRIEQILPTLVSDARLESHLDRRVARLELSR